MAAVCMSLMTTGSDWWFGTFFYDFPHIGNVIIPTDEVIFFRGVETTNQGCNWNIWDISDFLLILPGGPWAKKSHSLYEVLLEVGGFARTRRISHGDLNDSE